MLCTISTHCKIKIDKNPNLNRQNKELETADKIGGEKNICHKNIIASVNIHFYTRRKIHINNQHTFNLNTRSLIHYLSSNTEKD